MARPSESPSKSKPPVVPHMTFRRLRLDCLYETLLDCFGCANISGLLRYWRDPELMVPY